MIKAYLTAIIQDYFTQTDEEMPDITNQTKLVDLGLDSFAVYELVVALEEKYQIELDDETLEKLKNVGDLVACVESKRNNHANI